MIALKEKSGATKVIIIHPEGMFQVSPTVVDSLKTTNVIVVLE